MDEVGIDWMAVLRSDSDWEFESNSVVHSVGCPIGLDPSSSSGIDPAADRVLLHSIDAFEALLHLAADPAPDLVLHFASDLVLHSPSDSHDVLLRDVRVHSNPHRCIADAHLGHDI